MTWPERLSIALTLTLMQWGCGGDEQSPAPQEMTSGATESSETETAGQPGPGASSTGSSEPMDDSTSGSSLGQDESSDASTGAPELFERPEECSEVDACTLSCWAESQVPYLFGCGTSQCSVPLDHPEAEVRCAIEALRDSTPGRVVVNLGYTELNKDDFIEEYVVFEISSSGRILRAAVEQEYDVESGADYETDLWLPKLARPIDDPIWAACLDPEPDVNCLLGSDLFAEGCIDEPLALCE